MKDLFTIVLIISPILIFMSIYLVLLSNSNHKEKKQKWFDSDDSHIF